MHCEACGNDNPVGARFCNACAAPLEEKLAVELQPSSVGGGRYVIDNLVGEGARKRVYAGLDVRLGRKVAVAVVKTEGLDAAGRERIQREARAMARLGDHPNIVTVHDVGDDDGQPYIVSQLMPGGSVAELLDRASDRRIPIDEALRIAIQVARALEHAHEYDVIHRDVKPANIWRASDDTVRLGDFGLAATADHSRLTREGLVVGTVAYLAPEQAVGRAPDARSDLYSLGALLYELVSGRPPFLGDDAVTVISQHLNTTAVAPSWHNAEVPTTLDSLILRMLAKDPSDRPQSATTVIDELGRIAEAPPEPAPQSLSAPSRLPMGRLVGRGSELAELTSAFDEAVSGRGRLVMVVGEPGIGKTRLVEELAVYASLRGATVCWGHCYEGELTMPYLPFVEAFRTYVRERPDEQLRTELSGGAPEVATLVSELRQRFADLPSSPPLEGDADRMRLFEGVAAFLRNAASGQPLVLLLDDLHWADKPTLLMLHYLARNLRRDRVLLVGTYRDVELDRTHPLADTVAALRHEHLYERVLLRGLAPVDVKALIDAFDDQDSPIAFAERIHKETEGNPFFVAEILRHLAETGAIYRVDGVWTGDAEAVAENLPEGVREVIGRRLSRMGADCNRMLSVGAAMPGGFALDVVAAVVELDDERVLDLLDEALAAQVLRERRDAPGVYEFSHALFRQTLYGELSTPRRVRLHRQIASALEQSPGRETDLGELAFHCFQGAPGGNVAKAIDYATRAAERARTQAAHEETARFYDMALQALELSETRDDERRALLLLASGEAHNRAGETAQAAIALDEATSLARRLGDAQLFGRVALALASVGIGGVIHRPDVIAVLAEAAEGIGDTNNALLARLLSRQAWFHAFIDQDRLVGLADQAVAAGRRSGDPGALAPALTIWVVGLTGPDQAEQRRRTRVEIGRLAEQTGDLDGAIMNQRFLVDDAVVAGDRASLDGALAELVRLAIDSRSPPRLADASASRAYVAALEGRYGDAEQLAAELLAIGRQIQDPVLVNNFGPILYPVWRELGRVGEFETATRKAIDESPGAVAYRAAYANLLRDIGKDTEAAEQLAVLGTEGFATIPHDTVRTYNLCASAELAASLGDTQRAEQLSILLRPWSGTAAVVTGLAYHGAIDRFLGLLELCQGRANEAVICLEQALVMHDEMGARPWSARTRYDLARALLARGDPGDPDRAVSALNSALEAANVIGMPKLVEEALAVKLELQGMASSSQATSIDAVAARVSVERPDLRDQAAADGRVTIVFSDIEGYSAMIERLGDEQTQALLRDHNTIVRREVEINRGREVKSQGDGFMLAFTEPGDALGFAVSVQRAINGHDFGGEAVRVRIGIHAGEVIREADDFYGRTVVLASRVADQARGGEVLVTPAVRDAVPLGTFDDGRQVALKGLTGSHTVYGVVWHSSSR